jgi:hypothetical protein
VKVSRKEESLKTVQDACIALLDLSFNAADIEQIAGQGAESLQNGYAEGVKESLTLLAELLSYRPPPKAFRVRHHEIYGATSEKSAGEILYGPIIIFSLIDNSLKLINAPISTYDKNKLEFFRQVAQGNEPADADGSKVFAQLQEWILKNNDA